MEWISMEALLHFYVFIHYVNKEKKNGVPQNVLYTALDRCKHMS